MRDFDIRYDYDGQWLYGALLESRDPRAAEWHPAAGGGRITARDVAEWLHERRLAHPPGTVTAHHIDSHDSFWGHALFRRQVYGPDAWRPCFALCALTDGCIMHYIGGELGNEAFTQRIMELRRELPEIRFGDTDFRAVQPNDEMVLAVLHSAGDHHTIPVLNFADRSAQVKLTLPAGRMALTADAYTLYDALGDHLLRAPGDRAWNADSLRCVDLDLPPYGVAVLVLRPA
jgi:hypothetical protein